MRRHLPSFLAYWLICCSANAAVSQIVLINRSEAVGGAAFGSVGAYECIQAKIHFAVDPRLAPNQMVADIDLAPRDASGLVEFSADLYMLMPRDSSKGNGTALVEISNRGGKALPMEFDFAHGSVDPDSQESLGDGFLLRQGFTLVWVGWEFDVPDRPGVLRANLPVATNHGKTITGVVRSEWTGDERQQVIPLGDKGQIGYAVLDPESPNNELLARDTVLGARRAIPHSRWRFSDRTHAALDGGFAPGRIYEVVYETSNPPVAGLGMAGVRDLVSFLKYGGADTLLRDEHTNIKRVVAFGVSQSGRFLREFLYDGFNEDERGRKVFDGVWAHVAGAGRGSFNQRFPQPSRDGHPFLNLFYPVDVPPFDDRQLLVNARRAHVVPKLFLTNGSYEYWGRCASLIHTTIDGKADDPPTANTRIYFFAGSQHTVGTIPPRSALTQNATNVNDYRYGLRALLIAMQEWLASGTEPPQSVFPRLSNGDLTTIAGLQFPRISGINIAQHKREAYRLDFSTEPPKTGAPFPTFVPQVDANGNERAGIKMPEVAVPLASYTGWNLRSPPIGAPTELLSFVGSWIPFVRTDAELHGDPRSSIAKLYSSEQGYLDRIDQAAAELVRARFMLKTDMQLTHERAAKEWEYRQGLK